MKLKKIENKRGISPIVGYVLLITIGISLGAFVYSWMRSNIPRESLKCPDSVSITLESYTYDCNKNHFNFSIKNNGLFSVAGYIIRATNSPQHTVATIALSQFYDCSPSQGNCFTNIEAPNTLRYATNSIAPGSSLGSGVNYFNLVKTGTSPFTGTIARVELIPVMMVNQTNGIPKPVLCNDATTQERVSCSIT